MKSYLRFLSRNKLYTAIEVVGLSLAMAFAIPTINWFIQYFDSRYGYEDYRNTWTVTNNYGYIGAAPELGKVIKESIPEIEKISTADMRDKTYELNGYTATAFRCDSMFFEMFPMRFIEGDKSFVNVPTQICISEKFAEHLAQDGKPVLGREVVLGESAYMIAAVIENQGNGAIRYSDMIVPLGDTVGKRGHSRQCVTVFSIRDTTGLRRKLQKLCTDYYGFKEPEEEIRHINLVRYDDFCSHPGQSAFVQRHIRFGITLCAISLILIAIALMNYCNLSIALTTRRAKEFATHKLIGADSSVIYRRLFIEALVFCALCFLIAIPLSGTMSELISSLLSISGIISHTGFISDISFSIYAVISYLTLIVLTTLISALPPALLINHFSPLDITKGEFRYYSRKTSSKIFLCIQMMLAIALISISMIIYTEYRLYIKADTNCDIDDVFAIIPNDRKSFPYDMFLSELERCPYVLAAGLTYGVPNSCEFGSLRINDERIDYELIICDEEAFGLYGFHELKHYGSGTHGLWITDGFLNRYEGFPDLPKHVSDEWEIEEIAGRMATFTSLAGNYRNSKPVVVVIERSQIMEKKSIFTEKFGGLPYIAIKTVPNHKTARKAIAEVYSKATGKIVSDMTGFGVFSGYITNDIIDHYYGHAKSMASSIGKVALLAVIMVIAGMFGISIYFTSEQEKQTAIRKTFGADTAVEVRRMLNSYLRITVIADIVVLPFIYLFWKQMVWEAEKHTFPMIGIMSAAVMISFAICLTAVLWQTLRAARTNPAEALKKE